MRDAPAGLLPNFLRGSTIVRLPVRRIAVLIRVEIPFRVGRDDLMDATNCAVGALIAGGNDESGPQSTKDALSLARGAIRQAKFHRIAERCPDHGVRNSRIAAGGIDDGLAGSKSAAGQAGLNHA